MRTEDEIKEEISRCQKDKDDISEWMACLIRLMDKPKEYVSKTREACEWILND